MTDFIFKDPLRNIRWFDADKFPYEKSEDEIQTDFIFKGAVYALLLTGGALWLVEGGWLIYAAWLTINFFRRGS